MQSEDRDYHLQRARDEARSASRALEGTAAASHLRLSALHMKQARALGATERAIYLEVVSD